MTIVSSDAQLEHIVGLLGEVSKLISSDREPDASKFDDLDARNRLDHFTCKWVWENRYPPYQGTVTVQLTASWEDVSRDKDITSLRPNNVTITYHQSGGRPESIEARLEKDSPIECTSRPARRLLWLLNRPKRWLAVRAA